uniref:ORF1 n=1 Tax=Monilinia hypovirus A TaxID=2592772 RepID=A0A7G3W8U5_9VIRU|nr:ORF1 [Monilinia hypovirus A]
MEPPRGISKAIMVTTNQTKIQRRPASKTGEVGFVYVHTPKYCYLNWFPLSVRDDVKLELGASPSLRVLRNKLNAMTGQAPYKFRVTESRVGTIKMVHVAKRKPQAYGQQQVVIGECSLQAVASRLAAYEEEGVETFVGMARRDFKAEVTSIPDGRHTATASRNRAKGNDSQSSDAPSPRRGNNRSTYVSPFVRSRCVDCKDQGVAKNKSFRGRFNGQGHMKLYPTATGLRCRRCRDEYNEVEDEQQERNDRLVGCSCDMMFEMEHGGSRYHQSHCPSLHIVGNLLWVEPAGSEASVSDEESDEPREQEDSCEEPDVSESSVCEEESCKSCEEEDINEEPVKMPPGAPLLDIAAMRGITFGEPMETEEEEVGYTTHEAEAEKSDDSRRHESPQESSATDTVLDEESCEPCEDKDICEEPVQMLSVAPIPNIIAVPSVSSHDWLSAPAEELEIWARALRKTRRELEAHYECPFEIDNEANIMRSKNHKFVITRPSDKVTLQEALRRNRSDAMCRQASEKKNLFRGLGAGILGLHAQFAFKHHDTMQGVTEQPVTDVKVTTVLSVPKPGISRQEEREKVREEKRRLEKRQTSARLAASKKRKRAVSSQASVEPVSELRPSDPPMVTPWKSFDTSWPIIKALPRERKRKQRAVAATIVAGGTEQFDFVGCERGSIMVSGKMRLSRYVCKAITSQCPLPYYYLHEPGPKRRRPDLNSSLPGCYYVSDPYAGLSAGAACHQRGRIHQ